MRYFLVLVMAGLLSSCNLSRSPSTHPVAREYIPQYITYELTLNKRYRIQHDYFTGGRELGIGGCAYGPWPTPPEIQAMKKNLCGDIYEENGRIFKLIKKDISESGEPIYKTWPSDISNYVLGQHAVSKLGGGKDAQGNPLPLFVNEYIRFIPFCSDWVGGFSFEIYLQKSSSSTISQEIAFKKHLLDEAYNSISKWKPESRDKRGDNEWIVFKSWNRAIYMADVTDDYYLPIGDGQYYYHANFSYKSASIKNDPDQYAKGRAMFNHILDSFKIERLP